MEQQRGVRALLLACALTSTAALVTTALAGLPPLDVAVWAVLAPMATGGLLALLARLRAYRARRARGVVVVPDPVPEPDDALDPAVRSRAEAVAQARAALLDAKDRDEPLEALLALARALHDAELALAAAHLATGGHVPQAVRDELALRDRSGAPVTSG